MILHWSKYFVLKTLLKVVVQICQSSEQWDFTLSLKPSRLSDVDERCGFTAPLRLSIRLQTLLSPDSKSLRCSASDPFPSSLSGVGGAYLWGWEMGTKTLSYSEFPCLNNIPHALKYELSIAWQYKERRGAITPIRGESHPELSSWSKFGWLTAAPIALKGVRQVYAEKCF